MLTNNSTNECLNPALIPQELKGRNQWVAWKSQEIVKGQKPTKIPMNPTGGYAKSDDPKTWGTFEAVINCLNNGKKLSGIGFVVNYNDPFTGFDLDHCRNAETSIIEPWAMEEIRGLNSYTEITPSGTGIRIFAEGRLNDRGRKKGNIEAYSSHHFLTVTGNHLGGTPTTIEKRQAEIDSFYQRHFAKDEPQEKGIPKPSQTPSLDDQKLIEKIRQSKSGDKFQKLLNGDFSDYTSWSEGDFALCAMLAFWTANNPAQIDSIFRQSGLMRGKWDEKHGQLTYGDLTIKKAIEGTTEVYDLSVKVHQNLSPIGEISPKTESQTRPLTHLEPEEQKHEEPSYLTLNLPTSLEISRLEISVEWTVQNLIPKESITLLHSIGGVGKTYLMYKIGKCVADGIPFFGLDVKSMNVYYIDYENPLPEIADRMRKIGGSDNLRIWHLGHEPMPIRFDANEWEIYKTFPPGLFIIDSLRSSHLLEENSSKDASLVMARHKELRSLGSTIFLIHHESKTGGYRGSTAWFDLADHILKFGRVRKIGSDEDVEDDNFDLPIRLGLGGKSRFSSAMELTPMYFKFEDHQLCLAEDPDNEMLNKMALLLGNGKPPNQTEFQKLVKDNLGIGRKSFLKLLKDGDKKNMWFAKRSTEGNKFEYFRTL